MGVPSVVMVKREVGKVCKEADDVSVLDSLVGDWASLIEGSGALSENFIKCVNFDIMKMFFDMSENIYLLQKLL